jgi:uncharacterized protein (DUF885 family)
MTDQPGDAADRLDALATAYWEETLEASPVFATSLGDHRYDDRLPDLSPEALAARRRRLRDQLDAVEALAPDGLAPAARVTRAALRETVIGDLAELVSGLLAWTVDPLEGVPVGLLTIPDLQPVETPDDGRRMVARWRAMGAFVDTHIAGLRASLADGRVAAAAPLARVRAQLERQLATPTEDWPLVRPAAGAGPERWSATERERFRDALTDAVERDVRPAFARLLAALTDGIAPAARGDDAAGLASVPGGEAAYAGLVRRHTSLDAPARTFHDTGLREIARIDEELRDLAGRVLGTRTLADAIAHLRTDPALAFTTRDEVEATAVACLRRAEAALPAQFGHLPVAPCVVVRMGSFEEADSTIAYYRQPAADGSRPGQYYINTSEPATRPRYEAEALAFHEAVPGHHTQLAIAQELHHLPAFRRHLGSTAYVEGWGLYAERLADEMGLYTSDLDRIGVLSYDAWRASRLVVDTGLHALGWSRERAIAFMTEHTALAPNNIANEVDRYIVWPGQSLAYKTGQLELLRLRAEARERQADRFDSRVFHDTVLGEGALPLGALRALVEERLPGPTG